MDPHAYATAKSLTHRWLDANKSWNYGRYHADVATEFYTLLGLDYNHDKHDGSLKARVTKNIKRVWEEVLSEKVYDGDSQLAQKAAQILGQFEKNAYIFNNVVFQGNATGCEVNIANQGESSSPLKRRARSPTPNLEKELPAPPPYEVPPHKKPKNIEPSLPAGKDNKLALPVDNADNIIEDDDGSEASQLPPTESSDDQSFELPSDFFAVFDAIPSDCDGCCIHPQDCDGCCMHPPTEVPGSQRRTASPFQEYEQVLEGDKTTLGSFPGSTHHTPVSDRIPEAAAARPLSPEPEAVASSPPPSINSPGLRTPVCPCATRVERLERLVDAQRSAIRGIREFLLQRHESERRLLLFLENLENGDDDGHDGYGSEHNTPTPTATPSRSSHTQMGISRDL